MTTQQIDSARNEKGIYSASNESAGWYAISRDGIHMIEFANGQIKFYTELGFARRLTQLLNRGW